MLNENDIITIDISTFHKQLMKFDDVNISSNYIKKKQDLESSHTCFSMDYENRFSDWIEKKHYIAKHSWKDNRNQKQNLTGKTGNRLHILPVNFTEEEKTKKRFTGFMNKLTETNSHTIIPQINDEISNSSQKDVLYKIIWNFIEISAENRYIKILNNYDQTYNLDAFTKYVIENNWYPHDYILNKNILNLPDSEYDVYCEYVKWKKQKINILKGWCGLWKKEENIDLFETLLENIFNVLDTTIKNNPRERKHVVDYCLENLNIILERCDYKRYIYKLTNINESNIETSSKFLLRNILETYKK